MARLEGDRSSLENRFDLLDAPVAEPGDRADLLEDRSDTLESASGWLESCFFPMKTRAASREIRVAFLETGALPLGNTFAIRENHMMPANDRFQRKSLKIIVDERFLRTSGPTKQRISTHE